MAHFPVFQFPSRKREKWDSFPASKPGNPGLYWRTKFSISYFHKICKLNQVHIFRYTQCGNFMIFLSLRFYVKAIFVESISAESAILTHLGALNFEFHEFCIFWRLQSTKLTKFRAPNMAKMALELLNSPKLISRKIWVTEKFCNFHTIHTLLQN